MEFDRHSPWTFFLTWSVLFTATLVSEAGYVIRFNLFTLAWASSVLMALPFIGVFYYITGRLYRTGGVFDQGHRLVVWAFSGMVLFLLSNMLLAIALPPSNVFELYTWMRWAVVGGGGAGAFAGLLYARSIQQVKEAERARIEAQKTQQQNQCFEYLNAVLRHEVLNTAQAIVLCVELIEDELPPEVTGEVEDEIEVVKRQTDEMETVVSDVRLLLQLQEGEIESSRMHLYESVKSECEKIQDRHPGSDVSVDVDCKGVKLLAHQSFRRTIGNLVRNGLQHNESETPVVNVGCEVDESGLVISITDNGPGIPSADVDSLFDFSRSNDGSHGMGVPLSKWLVDIHGGELEIEETDERGTTFTVQLPSERVLLDGSESVDEDVAQFRGSMIKVESSYTS